MSDLVTLENRKQGLIEVIWNMIDDASIDTTLLIADADFREVKFLSDLGCATNVKTIWTAKAIVGWYTQAISDRYIVEIDKVIANYPEV